MNPTVSIIVPVYNTKPEYLSCALSSIAQQTYKDYEIIILDDHSTLDYPNNSFANISKLTVYKNQKHEGICKTISKALQLCKGKYIVRVDSDDAIMSTLLEKEVSFLENNEDYGAVCCDLQRVGLECSKIRRPEKWDMQSILDGETSGTGFAGGMMFRAGLLKTCSLDTTLPFCEDFDFHLQLLQQAKINSLHEPLYLYRVHPQNTTGTDTFFATKQAVHSRSR